MSHKFFYMPHGFPFFRPPVASRRLTESAWESELSISISTCHNGNKETLLCCRPSFIIICSEVRPFFSSDENFFNRNLKKKLQKTSQNFFCHFNFFSKSDCKKSFLWTGVAVFSLPVFALLCAPLHTKIKWIFEIYNKFYTNLYLGLSLSLICKTEKLSFTKVNTSNLTDFCGLTLTLSEYSSSPPLWSFQAGGGELTLECCHSFWFYGSCCYLRLTHPLPSMSLPSISFRPFIL